MPTVATSVHGRWYTRTVDDPITGVGDESSGVSGGVDTSWIRDFVDHNPPAGTGKVILDGGSASSTYTEVINGGTAADTFVGSPGDIDGGIA